MTISVKPVAAVLACLGLVVVAHRAAWAQNADAVTTRIVSVDGRNMRIRMAGVENRMPGQPVIILEAGAGDPTPGFSPLDTWTSLIPRLISLGPVVAYERRGWGMSEPDVEVPTLRRVARVLHDLLRDTRVPPPYVLVGHSWGGNYIRAFVDAYPTEVVGLVFLDAFTGQDPTRAEKAAVVSPDARAATLAPPVLPPLPANTPPGARAELEQVGREMVSDGQESRSFRPVRGIPVALVFATPPGRMRGDGGAITRLTIQRGLELALSAPNGMLVTASHVGHAVHQRDPQLVADLVRHVLQHRPDAR